MGANVRLIGMISCVREVAAVVFVPGFMQRGDAWSPVADVVGERYPSTCLDFTTWTLRERLAEIAATAPRDAVLAGYSMGGRLAMRAALSEPGRYAGLVLVGAGAGIEDPAERAQRRTGDEELAAWMEQSPIEAVVERWEAQPVFASQPPELVSAQRPGRLSHDPARLAELMRSAGQGAMDPVWSSLAELETPLLAIAGESDERYVRAADRMASLAPSGRAALVLGAGHAAQLERPGEVAGLVLDFLDELSGRAVPPV
jgi:2-succinyl-6-hydroxy-2,4-cyclohexadiene-1-carboxylate synthase